VKDRLWAPTSTNITSELRKFECAVLALHVISEKEKSVSMCTLIEG